MKNTSMIFLCTLLASTIASATSDQFFIEEFIDREGCFLLVDIKTKKVIDSFNVERCEKRFAPMSTFKIPLVAMGFDSKFFERVDQKIKWDGKNRSRKSVNRDQTPKSFIDHSVIWVSRLIINFLGQESVQKYVDKINYGNKKVSGDFDSFWLSKGSIKISAHEQIQFLSRLWREHLPLNKDAIKLTKEATFDQEINGLKVHGKTGTGCIDKGCMNQPGRQLGWFVGIAENEKRSYAFALNFSDKKPVRGYGGPKARKIVHRYFEKFNPKN